MKVTSYPDTQYGFKFTLGYVYAILLAILNAHAEFYMLGGQCLYY